MQVGSWPDFILPKSEFRYWAITAGTLTFLAVILKDTPPPDALDWRPSAMLLLAIITALWFIRPLTALPGEWLNGRCMRTGPTRTTKALLVAVAGFAYGFGFQFLGPLAMIIFWNLMVVSAVLAVTLLAARVGTHGWLASRTELALLGVALTVSIGRFELVTTFLPLLLTPLVLQIRHRHLAWPGLLCIGLLSGLQLLNSGNSLVAPAGIIAISLLMASQHSVAWLASTPVFLTLDPLVMDGFSQKAIITASISVWASILMLRANQETDKILLSSAAAVVAAPGLVFAIIAAWSSIGTTAAAAALLVTAFAILWIGKRHRRFQAPMIPPPLERINAVAASGQP